ncbi:chromate efflux transporter [Achromobacter sp. GG226]|uniref:chromate efflux transporter n=1 Tax=Verticiella alkaliphila TaxID=2779529 RepID=UPI001C0AC5AF|nr:chromate efflux transporter [Verticiella sp. GG226]MBU4612841.1 chromate efflux transporter [Verticiella sp. GG226]
MSPSPLSPPGHSAWQVFLVFLRLGLTSFGGPVAHLGYFRTEFVTRRRWLDEHAYAELVALCQFLPGPASSQVGMALGLGRAGWSGAFAAWAGFTLPSAIALILFGMAIGTQPTLAAAGWVHGLKLAAVAIVAHAVLGMWRSLCPDTPRAALALLAAGFVLVVPHASAQFAVIALAGLTGWRWLDPPASATGTPLVARVAHRAGLTAFVLLIALLAALPLAAWLTGSTSIAMIDGVFRAGTLVFGGGHVVLPLLQGSLIPLGVLDDNAFLAGYGAAQAVPGPLFTLAAYLGAVAQGPLHGWVGGLVLLVTIFVPAFLLVVSALAFWQTLRERPGIRRAVAGINAGVVGILCAALYDPVFTSAVISRADAAVALSAFGLLTLSRTPPIAVVALCAVAGALLA